MSAPPSVRARSFDAWAADYDRYRPSYPEALFDVIAARLGLPSTPEVVDVGAGTGKATLAMAARGWRVTAVEPGEPMLAVLERRAQEQAVNVSTVVGTAEATSLPDASADLVTAGEAYHWFDAPRALGEMARIVRPRGGIACFWNVRDVDASALLADYDRLGAIVGAERGADARPGPREQTRRQIREAGGYDEPMFEQVRHSIEMNRKEFIGLAFTKSHVRTADPVTQAAFREQLEELLDRHSLTGDRRVAIPYVVDCWIARRKGS